MGSSGGVVAGDWRVESDEAALRVGRLECGHLLRSELGRKPRKRERKRKQKYPIFGGKIGMLHEGGKGGGVMVSGSGGAAGGGGGGWMLGLARRASSESTFWRS